MPLFAPVTSAIFFDELFMRVFLRVSFFYNDLMKLPSVSEFAYGG
jgi:hypothetical protein